MLVDLADTFEYENDTKKTNKKQHLYQPKTSLKSSSFDTQEHFINMEDVFRLAWLRLALYLSAAF